MSKPQRYDSLQDFSWMALARAFVWLVGRHKRQYFGYTTVLFFLYFCGLYPLYMTGKIVDMLAVPHPTLSSSLTILVASIGAVYVVTAVGRLALKRRLGDVRSDIMYGIRVRGFELLIDQLFLRDSRDMVGGRVQQLQNGIVQFQQLSKLSDNVISVGIATFIGIIITFIFTVHWYFVVFLLIYLAVAVYIIDHFTYQQIYLAEQYYKKSESTAGVFVEGVSNALTVKAQGAQAQFQTRVSDNAEAYRKFEYARRKIGIFKWQIFQTVNGLTYMSFLLMASYAAIRGEMTIGAVAIVAAYMMRVIDKIGEFMEAYDDFIEARQGIARMMKIFWRETAKWPGTEPFPKRWDQVTFDHVDFTYEGGKETVRDVSLEISRGTCVGVRGKTGSGKSTLTKLLIGLYRLEKGSITIGKKLITEIDHDELLTHIAIVLQESELFAMSLRDNIALMKDISEDKLQEVIRVAQLTDMVARLPAGLDTMIGEKGYRLSGGEKQRVAIARALCKDAQILVLDEATSALDLKTESTLVAALHDTYPEMTMLIIAHRPQALIRCDRVYTMERGRVVL